MSSPRDPVVLLNVLQPILDKQTGGIREASLANRFVNVMRDARKLAQRCMYLNIFDATKSEDIRKEILNLGGWDILYDWLKDAERVCHWTVARDILQLFIHSPVTFDLLRSNSAPRLVKRISKRQDIQADIRNLATDILSIWKDIIIDSHFSEKEVKEENGKSPIENSPSNSNGMTSIIDPNIDMEAVDEPYTVAPVSSSNYSSRPFGEGKSAQDPNTHLKVKKPPPPQVIPAQPQKPHHQSKFGKANHAEKSISKQPNQNKQLEKVEKSPEDKQKSAIEKKSNAVAPKRTHEQSSVDAFSTAISGMDDAGTAVASKRPKTVKTIRNASRSTGLDQEPEPSTNHVKKRKAIADLTALKKKDILDKNQIKEKLQNSSTSDKKPTTPAAVSSFPRKLSAGSVVDQISDQQVVSPTSLVPGAAAISSSTTTKPPHKTTPPSNAKTIQMIESDSFMAALTGSSQPRSPAVIRKKKLTGSTDTSTKNAQQDGQQISIPKPQFYKEIIPRTTSSAASDSPRTPDTSSTAATDNGTTSKPGKKRVTWAKDQDLVRVQLFELEEGERAHKAFGLKNSNLASLDKKMEREAMEAAKKGMHKLDSSGTREPEAYFNWKLIPCDGVADLVVKGSGSEEKKIQAERMAKVLAEIYFPYESIPDAPKEPDLLIGGSSQQASTPVIIPLDEVPADDGVPVPIAGVPPIATSTSLPPEIAALIQNLNKKGILPQPTPTTSTNPGFGMPPPPIGAGFLPMTQAPPPFMPPTGPPPFMAQTGPPPFMNQPPPFIPQQRPPPFMNATRPPPNLRVGRPQRGSGNSRWDRRF